MNETDTVNSFLVSRNLKEVSHRDAAVSTDLISSQLLDNDGQETPSPRVSESSLDVFIPSYPGTPRSISVLTSESVTSNQGRDLELQRAVDYLHTDFPLIDAAAVGHSTRIEELLRIKTTDVNQQDQLGRTALHLAVYSGDINSIMLLLKAGIAPNVKDQLGITPLSLCVLRSPSVLIANLLFDHGAEILPRLSPMDTGLFIQFVSICEPSYEDEKILELLVKKGALVNDPDAPGGRQPLHIAAMGNNCRLIKKLIELGAKLYLKNQRGETPKVFAMNFKCMEAYELLDTYDDRESCDISASSCSLMPTSLSRDDSTQSRHFRQVNVSDNTANQS